MNDDNKNMCKCEGGCGTCHTKNEGGANAWCSCCAGWGPHKMGHHVAVRIILAIAILAIVFKVGVEFGEFKGQFMGGSRHMQFGPRTTMMQNDMMGLDTDSYYFQRGF